MTNALLHEFAAHQRSQSLSRTTIRNRESILRTLERWTGAPLLDLSVQQLRAYLGRESDRPEGISAGTRRTERGAMAAFYSFLVNEGLRDDDPTTKLPKITAPKGEPRPFTLEQVDAMLSSGAYRRTRVMILLGYYQGFRVSQIAAVHGHDIDLLSGTIRTVGKGSKHGTLPLHPMIAELAKTMPQDGFWFPARKGRTGHVSGPAVTNLITNAKNRAGITDPKLTPHSLRHAFATDLVEGGVDIIVIQKLMMHASLATTQIYSGVSERRKRDGIRALPVRELPHQSGRGALPAAA